MRKIITSILLFGLIFQLEAQSNIRLNNYWNNTQFVNPATIYDRYAAVFTMAGRLQWAGISGAPRTLFASGTTYIESMNTQLSLRLIQDKIGYTSTTNVTAAYGYAIQLSSDHQLHLGLGACFQSFNYDLSKVDMDVVDKDVYEHLKSESTYNVEVGLEYTNRVFKLGASSQNLMSVFRAKNLLDVNTNFVYAKYHSNSNTSVDWGLGTCAIQYDRYFQMEFAINAFFKNPALTGLRSNPDIFDVGLFYRTKSEIGLIIGYRLSDALKLSYSYDYNLGDISRGSFGTNELVLTYSLRHKPVCKNCWY